ncbi:MAG TPA: folate-binding protein [Acetobacteraceae bacterium]|nr:folate-binding protein [Acetobacteraceae bacterium]
MTHIAMLPERGVIEVSGEDRVAFLQGLVSNDVAKATPGRTVWAALLTPQGKWLADFFILTDGDRFLLDCEAGQIPMLVQRLGRFRLRSKVVVARRDELRVYAAWGHPVPASEGVIAPDPRLEQAGWRIVSDGSVAADADADAWDWHRLALGLPDGSRDLEAEKTVLLEAGFDELNGVSWSKGCYMGQELTARTKYRGLVKRRLVPVEVEGPLPSPGSPILRDGMEVGTMRSGRDERGMAVLRLDALRDTLACGEARLVTRVPDWMRLPEPVP